MSDKSKPMIKISREIGTHVYIYIYIDREYTRCAHCECANSGDGGRSRFLRENAEAPVKRALRHLTHGKGDTFLRRVSKPGAFVDGHAGS